MPVTEKQYKAKIMKAEAAEALAKALREMPSEGSNDRAHSLFEHLASLYSKNPSKLGKAELADALAKALREPPSEASNDKAHELFHELKVHFLVPAKGQTDMALRELSGNQSSEDTRFIYVLMSLIGAFVLSETSDVSSLKQNVKILDNNSQKSEETIAEMGRKIFQLDYHYSAIQSVHCLNCMKVLSASATPDPEPAIASPDAEPEGASVSLEQSPEDASAGPDLPAHGFWSSWKRWLFGGGSA